MTTSYHVTPNKRTRRRRGGLIAAALTMMTVILAGCPTYEGNTAGPKVALIGDSMFVLHGQTVQDNISNTHQTHRSSQSGATSIDMVDEAQAYYNEPNIAVVSLGINDAHQIANMGIGSIQNTYDNGFTHIRDAFTNASCIVYLMVDESMPNQDFTTLESMNNWWRNHASYWPHRYKLVDWNAAVAYFGGAANMTVDGVHPNTFGAQLVTDMLTEAIESCPA